MKKTLFLIVAIFLSCPMLHLGFCTLSTTADAPQAEIAKEKEIERQSNGNLYLLVLATTLPVISVFLILLVPKKTDQLIAFDLDKSKQKTVKLGLRTREKDDEILWLKKFTIS